MRLLRWLGGLFALLVVVALAAFQIPFVVRKLEPGILNPGPGSNSTPLEFGVPFERVGIASRNRTLDSIAVRANYKCATHGAVLLFHGQGETVGSWAKAQAFLYDNCLSSMVFDYSGHGRSSPHGTMAHLEVDSESAYQDFVTRFPRERRCVMSFSMGAGPMLDAIGHMKPAPDCVVIASAFTSLRDFGAAHGMPRALMYLMADVWDNARNVKRVRSPILVVHSRADRTIPFAMGEAIYAAAPEPKQLVLLDGFSHNTPYADPALNWWPQVIEFVSAGAPPGTPKK